jgi:spore maturation protein B
MYAAISTISVWLIPAVIVFILLFAAMKKVPVYESFVGGAKEGFDTAIQIIPHLVGMMVAIQMFRASGAMEWLVMLFRPLFEAISVPAEIFPLALLRPLTGAGSLAFMSDLTQQFGADSLVSKIAATIQASTDTTMYVITVYFGAVGIRKVSYALKVGLLSDVVGVVASVVICMLVFA